jgi:hypothetical protein
MSNKTVNAVTIEAIRNLLSSAHNLLDNLDLANEIGGEATSPVISAQGKPAGEAPAVVEAAPEVVEEAPAAPLVATAQAVKSPLEIVLEMRNQAWHR